MLEIKKQVLITVLTTIILGLLNLTSSYLLSDKAEIRIGNAIEYKSNIYLTSIDIFNFSKADIENIYISLPANIDLVNVKSDSPININKVTANVGNNAETFFEIQKILSKQQIRLLFETDKNIYSNDIKIFFNTKDINVEYSGDVISIFNKSITSVIISTLLYGIILGLLLVYNEKNRDTEIQKKITLLNECKKEIADLKIIQDEDQKKYVNMIEQLNNKTRKELTAINKTNIILLSRIKDYKKELDFWRDSIRKLLYKSKSDSIDSEKVIQVVTESLKTYQTNCNDSMSIDSINIMAEIFKNTDNP